MQFMSSKLEKRFRFSVCSAGLDTKVVVGNLYFAFRSFNEVEESGRMARSSTNH